MPARGFILLGCTTQVMPTEATAGIHAWTTATATEAIAGFSDGRDKHLVWRNRGGFLQALEAQFRQLSQLS